MSENLEDKAEGLFSLSQKAVNNLLLIGLAAVLLLQMCGCEEYTPAAPQRIASSNQEVFEATMPINRMNVAEKRAFADSVQSFRYSAVDMATFLSGRELFATNFGGAYTESPNQSDTLQFTEQSRTWSVNGEPDSYGLVRINPSEKYLFYYAEFPGIGNLLVCESIASDDYLIYLIDENAAEVPYLIQENPDSYVWGNGNTSTLEAFLFVDGQFLDMSLPENQGQLLSITWRIDYIDENGQAQAFEELQTFGSSPDFGVFTALASSTDNTGLWLQPCQITTAQWTITGVWPGEDLNGSRICPTTRQGEVPPSQPSCESVACDFTGFEIV